MSDPSVECLDLEALQSLPQLSRLVLLDGCYEGLEALEDLTTLQMTRARAHCDYNCCFAAGLKDLDLENSNLVNFHDLGLSACVCLEGLRCVNSSILSSSPNQHQDMQFSSNHPIREPSDLSGLTAVEALVFAIKGSEGHPRLEWLTQLSTLKLLCVQLEVS